MGQKCVWICVAFLVVGAFASQECGVDRANECKQKLLDILFGDFSEEEACGELYGVGKCLRNVVDDCLGEEEQPEVEQSLKEFEDFLDNNCGASPESDEDAVDKCLKKNQEYFFQCLFDEETGDISKLMDVDSIPAHIDPEFAQCYLFGLMAHCVAGRAEERCGAAGGKRVADELSKNVPSSVMDSCNSQPESAEEIFAFHLLGQRKKRTPQDWLAMNFRKR